MSTLDAATLEQLWKDPDWVCPDCRFVNMAIRSRCRNFSCDFRWEDEAVALVVGENGIARPWVRSNLPAFLARYLRHARLGDQRSEMMKPNLDFLVERDTAINNAADEFVSQFCGGSESLTETLAAAIYSLFDKFGAPTLRELKEEAFELDGYSLEGCADRADVTVRVANGLPLAADWNRFAAEINKLRAGDRRELTAEDVRTAWLEIGAGPGAHASGWYSLLANKLNAALAAAAPDKPSADRQETSESTNKFTGGNNHEAAKAPEAKP